MTKYKEFNIINNKQYNSLSKAECLMFSALQGLASKTESLIYCIANNFNDIKFEPLAAKLWLSDFEIPKVYFDDTIEIIKKYKNINEYILCDTTKNPDSANIATTLSGITGALPVDKSLEELFIKLKYKKLIDVSTFRMIDFLKDYVHEYNHNQVVELSPTIFWGPRDFAVASKTPVIYGQEQRDFLLNQLSTSSPVYGWGPVTQDGEKEFITNVSQYGDYYVAADCAFNLTALSQMDVRPLSCPPDISTTDDSASNDKAQTDDKKYVAFVMSDGDNLQWLLNRGNYTGWWGSPYRGLVPIGWTFSPSLYDLAPSVWNYYIESLSDNDEVICGASGIGYVFEDISKTKKFSEFLKKTDAFLGQANINTVAIFGNQYPCETYLKGYTGLKNVDGVIYTSYSPWVVPQNKNIYNYDGKYIIPQNLDLSGNPDQIINTIKTGNSKFYMIYVNAWGNTNDPMSSVYSVYKSLKDQKDIVFMKPSKMFNIFKSTK
ncbi:hypothetical protein NAC44_02385 [Allorhizobium sp. BGMRC 0089]|uniref:GxGYxYP domain-containing protein n=1 Tax=Allorhizobium sonneratiae TaxID=2934936 RepID=UPI00203365F6|nr:GxGYxYP domain-containing protein [Allorhizobium sonneratiae]MCM2291176.1 hypothetical protein [Allorhizobium sonneratiae]